MSHVSCLGPISMSRAAAVVGEWESPGLARPRVSVMCHTNMSQCPTFSCVCARAELRAAVPAVHAGGAALPADPALPPRPGRPRPPEALPTLGQGDSPARVCPPPAQAAVQIRPRQPGKFYDLNLKMKI